MRVGVGAIRFEVSGSRSLKDKRQVVRRIKDQVHRKFNVSIAEVDALDDRAIAELAFACVSNDGRHADSVVQSVLRFIEASFPIVVLEITTELW